MGRSDGWRTGRPPGFRFIWHFCGYSRYPRTVPNAYHRHVGADVVAKTHANAHWSLSHAYAHQGHAHTKTLNFNPYLANWPRCSHGWGGIDRVEFKRRLRVEFKQQFGRGGRRG